MPLLRLLFLADFATYSEAPDFIRVRVRTGDLVPWTLKLWPVTGEVVAATDGVFDNLFDHQACEATPVIFPIGPSHCGPATGKGLEQRNACKGPRLKFRYMFKYV